MDGLIRVVAFQALTIGPRKGGLQKRCFNKKTCIKKGCRLAPCGSFCFEHRPVSRLVVFCDNINTSTFAIKHYLAFDQCEYRVVISHSHAFSGVEFGTTLPNDNVAGMNAFATEFLNAATLSVGVPTVTAGTLTFFMCHQTDPEWILDNDLKVEFY